MHQATPTLLFTRHGDISGLFTWQKLFETGGFREFLLLLFSRKREFHGIVLVSWHRTPDSGGLGSKVERTLAKGLAVFPADRKKPFDTGSETDPFLFCVLTLLLVHCYSLVWEP